MAKRAVAARPQPVEDGDLQDLIGHNSSFDTSVAADQLATIIERIEQLEGEKKAISDDIKDVYGEAKANGFDAKIIRKVVAMRRKDAEERKEEEAVMQLYLEALGMA